MAPDASILAATSAASSSNCRPADSDAEQQQLQLLLGESPAAALPQQQGDDDAEAAHKSHHQLPCPRCRSTNTKFCYYNNYSTAQPRHFCRACRRYWTHGGTLRDVPVGGATRRSKRRRLSAEPPQKKTAPALVEDVVVACPPDDLFLDGFPFFSDGSYRHRTMADLGLFAPPAFSGVDPDFYDGLAPWDDGTVGSGAAGVTAAWGDFAAGTELSWPPPGN